MLIIGRAVDEAFYIDVPPSTAPQRIRISVVDRTHGDIRIGIEADRSVNVWREELAELPEAAAKVAR